MSKMKIYILTLKATLRRSPDTGGAFVANATPGQQFTVLAELPAAKNGDQWLKVDHDIPTAPGEPVFIVRKYRGVEYGHLLTVDVPAPPPTPGVELFKAILDRIIGFIAAERAKLGD